AGESLIGLTVAVLSAAELGDSDLGRNAEGVFALRRAGGSWGLVVADRDLASATVLKVLSEAVERAAPNPAGPLQATGTTPSTLVSPPARGSGGSAAPIRKEVATGPSGASRPSPVTTGQPQFTPPVARPSEPAAQPQASHSPSLSVLPAPSTGEPKVLDVGPTGTGLDPVVDTVEDVLDGLLDNLLGVIRL
ncbi:MAG: hypothetical protein ACRDV9_11620, partial [Acidimicrobiia bacterium]